MGPRDFDAGLLAQREFDAWVAYYRHDWRQFLVSAVGMVRTGFGMSWPRTVRGAWYVLRANQKWAPVPDNDPDAAREYMRRFYELVRRDGRLSLEPAKAARLEVDWWRVHRLHQREDQLSEAELAEALVDLYSYVYGTDRDAVRDAALQRVVAMRYSDQWVADGCRDTDASLDGELSALRASYAALRAAVATIS